MSTHFSFFQNVIKQCVYCYFTRDPVLAIRRRLDVHVECMLKAGKFFRKFSGNYFCLKFKIFVFSLGLIHYSALDKGVCLIKYNNLNGSVIRSSNNQIDHCIYCRPIVIGSSQMDVNTRGSNFVPTLDSGLCEYVVLDPTDLQ